MHRALERFTAYNDGGCADLCNYDVISLEPPYTVQKYRDAIRAFEENGYDTIIVDSLSHAW